MRIAMVAALALLLSSCAAHLRIAPNGNLVKCKEVPNLSGTYDCNTFIIMGLPT